MTKSQIFVGTALSVFLGVLLGSRFTIPHFAGFAGMAASAALFGLSFYADRKKLCLAWLFLFCLALGIFRVQGTFKESQFKEMFETKQKFEAFVVEDTDRRLDKQLVTVQPKGFDQRILLTLPLTQEFFYGDWILVEGKVREPKNFEDFDYQKYLERFNVYAAISYPKVLILKSHQGNFIKEGLLRVKHAFSARISDALNEPQSSLLLGILIGARKTLPDDLVENFNRTGISHIVAISGFNITIIISGLGFLAWIVGRRLSFWLSLGFIAAFVVMAGATASVMRAAIMGFMLLFAFNLGRQYAVAPAMFFAGLIMVLINPRILFWDIGFQLSFAATLGIVYFMSPLSLLTETWENPLSIKDLLFTTLSAIAATLPLILFYFGRLSLAAPLVNLLVLPVIPWTMLFGFLTVIPFFGFGFALVAGLMLRYVIAITNYFGGLRFSSTEMPISFTILLVMYLAVFAAYFLLERRVKNGQPRRLKLEPAYDRIMGMHN